MSVRYERLPLRPGLGRHIHHDDRSLSYAVGVLPKAAIGPVHWTRRIPVLDQGNTGSCTGNSGTGWLGTDNAVRQGLTLIKDPMPTSAAVLIPLDEHFARDDLYSAATQVDPYQGSFPPTDTGSDGLSVAKVLKSWGLADSYSHAFSMDALASGLQSSPAMWGTPWYDSMFDVGNDGHLVVNLSSSLAGGHEPIIDQLDVMADGRRVYWFTNSWNTSWGDSGRAWLYESELASLKDGDFTFPVAPVNAPAPGPTPSPGGGGCFQVGPFTDRELSLASHRGAVHHQSAADWATARLKTLLR